LDAASVKYQNPCIMVLSEEGSGRRKMDCHSLVNAAAESAMKPKLRTTWESHISTTFIHKTRVKKPYESPMKQVVKMTRSQQKRTSSICYFNAYGSKKKSSLPTVMEEDENSYSSYSNIFSSEIYSLQILKSVSRSKKSFASELSMLVQSSEENYNPSEKILNASEFSCSNSSQYDSIESDQSLIDGLCIDEDID
jgi:hypothetical protein